MKCSSIWNSVPYKELFRLALEFCRVGRNVLPLKTFDFEGVGTFYSMARAWVCAQPSAGAVNRIFWHYLEDGAAGDGTPGQVWVTGTALRLRRARKCLKTTFLRPARSQTATLNRC